MSKKVDEIIKNLPSFEELVKARQSKCLNESNRSTDAGYIYLTEEEAREFDERLGFVDLDEFLDKMNSKYSD